MAIIVGIRHHCMNKNSEEIYKSDFERELEFHEINLEDINDAVSFLYNILKADFVDSLIGMNTPGNHLECDYTIVYSGNMLKNTFSLDFDSITDNDVFEALNAYREDVGIILQKAIGSESLYEL